MPVLHRAPILAKSVGAFWSRHYNLTVSRWLARHIARPLASRHGARIGLAGAFLASAILHVGFALPSVELPLAMTMGAFFLVQGIFILVERSFSVFSRLPTPLQRVFTVSLLLLSSPLFVEPLLRMIEPASSAGSTGLSP